MRKLIVLAATIATSGCAATSGALRGSETREATEGRAASVGMPGTARSGGIALGDDSFAAPLDRRAVSDSQDPIPITPAPMPAGSGGETGNPNPGNPVAGGKR